VSLPATRRGLILGGAAALAALPGCASAARRGRDFKEIETSLGATLGLYARDVASGKVVRWRARERFPMASTFKAFLAGVVLKRVDAGLERLDRTLAIPVETLSNSPRTQANAGGRMSVEALCAAIVTVSDNTGANLLLDTIGGPAGLTRELRALGDRSTRLDRYELAMNEAAPGDPRDTTTPEAAAGTLEKLVLGTVLSAASRERLTRWMAESTTGLHRIRAGVPKDWRVADKTGTGGRGSTNDVAVIWPTKGGPVVMTAYLLGSTRPRVEREAALAAAAWTATESLGFDA